MLAARARGVAAPAQRGLSGTAPSRPTWNRAVPRRFVRSGHAQGIASLGNSEGTAAVGVEVPGTSAACPAVEEVRLENGLASGVWEWKEGAKIAYRRAGAAGPVVLLVHGFGVGAFHFDANMLALAETHRVWAVDLLGQGGSWFGADLPGAEAEFTVCGDTWTEQLAEFLAAAVPGERAFVGGNSLGGYLSVNLAARHPELVAGLLLLNATPFWGFAPHPENAPRLSGLMPYNGALPPPQGLNSAIERLWFDRLRDPNNVKSLIALVYADASKADDALVSAIVDAARHPQAPSAFTSIVFSPKTRLDFDAMLDKVTCPVALFYGKEDPWVVPLWGQRIKRKLPEADYFEISPAGHCPHHEVPETVNRILLAWLETQADGGGDAPLAVGESWDQEEDGKRIITTHVSGGPRNVFEWFDYGMFKLRSSVSA